MMNFFALSGLINAITSTALCVFIYSRKRKELLYRTYVLFCLSVALWSYFYFAWQIAKTEELALIFVRMSMAAAVFIPVFYLHHILELLKIAEKKKRLIISGYIFAFISLIFNFTPYFIRSVSPKLYFEYWPNPGIAFDVFFLICFYLVIYSIRIIFTAFKQASGFRRNQLKYVLFA
ncbi:MAG: histidine kinase N-terminal 7TM domain-containing protein, partial [Candidatus Omnitrophota bacterium]